MPIGNLAMLGQPSMHNQVEPETATRPLDGGDWFGQNAPSGTTAAPALGAGDDYRAWVNQAYQQTRGRDATPEEMKTWDDYWNDWGHKDPAYLKDRLFNPEKYGGDKFGNPTGGAGGGQFGAFTTPYDKQFTLPTLAELQQMPGYQASLDASNRATQSSAAARGTLLTGGTLKALQQNAGNVAMQGYGTLASLANGVQGQNYQVFKDNQDRPFSKLSDLARLGAGAAGNS